MSPLEHEITVIDRGAQGRLSGEIPPSQNAGERIAEEIGARTFNDVRSFPIGYCIIELNLSDLAKSTAELIYNVAKQDPRGIVDDLTGSHNYGVYMFQLKRVNLDASFGLYIMVGNDIIIESDEIIDALEEEGLPSDLPLSHVSIQRGQQIRLPNIKGVKIVIMNVDIPTDAPSSLGKHGYVNILGWYAELVLFGLALKYLPKYASILFGYMLGIRRKKSMNRKLDEIKTELDVVKIGIDDILKRGDFATGTNQQEILANIISILAKIGVKLEIL